jgi:ABC-type transporter Mla subunit MlaD
MLPRLTTILIIVVGVITLTLFFSRPKLYRQEFKAYFKNGQALQSGAEVRVAGIPSGVVKSVQVRPEHREAPVEVAFEVQTTYNLQIPRDSIARLSTALLGSMRRYRRYSSDWAAGFPSRGLANRRRTAV